MLCLCPRMRLSRCLCLCVRLFLCLCLCVRLFLCLCLCVRLFLCLCLCSCPTCAPLTGKDTVPQTCIHTDKKRSFEATIGSLKERVEKAARVDGDKARQVDSLKERIQVLETAQRKTEQERAAIQTELDACKSNGYGYQVGEGREDLYWGFQGWM